MIILHNGKKGQNYAEEHSADNTVIDWRAADKAERQSFAMMAGGEPRQFPALYDRVSKIFLEGVGDDVAPNVLIADAAAVNTERNARSDAKKLAGQRIGAATIDPKGQLQNRVEMLETIVNDLVELAK